jgi:hypothetical protein
MSAELVIEVVLVHGLETPVGLGPDGVLIVTTGGETISVAVKPNETVRVPIVLMKGVTDVTLTLGAGNFRPADYGPDDSRVLSFACRAIDLVTAAVQLR